MNEDWRSEQVTKGTAVDALLELDQYAECAECIETIQNLPSAQPERKRGKWIEDGYNHYKAVCSECGEPCATFIMDKPRDNFCKWCGADMRGEQDG